MEKPASNRSLMELLWDPEEGPLLQAVLREPGAAARGAYEAWLRGRDDPRGELLRLGELLGRPEAPPGAAALRARFEELRKSCDPQWAGLALDRSWVLSCGEAAALSAPVRFAYECDRSWESFELTDNPGVRRCDGCDQLVYRCGTTAEAAAQARAGRCIAVPGSLLQQKQSLARDMTGRPHLPSLWAREIFGVDVENPKPR